MTVADVHCAICPFVGVPLFETLPPPEGVAHVPSPRQNVEELAELPPANDAIGRSATAHLLVPSEWRQTPSFAFLSVYVVAPLIVSEPAREMMSVFVDVTVPCRSWTQILPPALTPFAAGSVQVLDVVNAAFV